MSDQGQTAERSEAKSEERSTAPQALLVVVVLAGIMFLIVAGLAFSANNTPASINGDNVTTPPSLAE